MDKDDCRQIVPEPLGLGYIEQQFHALGFAIDDVGLVVDFGFGRRGVISAKRDNVTNETSRR